MLNTLASEATCMHGPLCTAIRHRTVLPETQSARWLRDDIAAGFRCWVLYRFYDRAGRLLYAGITRNSIERWRNHSYDKHWWIRVRLIDFTDYPTENEVRAAERQAIQTEAPMYNVAQAVA